MEYDYSLPTKPDNFETKAVISRVMATMLISKSCDVPIYTAVHWYDKNFNNSESVGVVQLGAFIRSYYCGKP